MGVGFQGAGISDGQGLLNWGTTVVANICGNPCVIYNTSYIVRKAITPIQVARGHGVVHGVEHTCDTL